MQPIMVRTTTEADAQGRTIYELVAGERRWRASREAKLATIPAIIRQVQDTQAAELSLIENLQREDLNPIERAMAFKRLIEQFKLSHEAVAQRVGVERPTISNSLRLLDLCDDVRLLVVEGLLSSGQAKAIASLSRPDHQLILAKRAVTQELSVRQVEVQARLMQGDAGQVGAENIAPAPVSTRAAHLADLEGQLTRQLGLKTHLRQGRRKGSGTLSIDFPTAQQFESLLERLKIQLD